MTFRHFLQGTLLAVLIDIITCQDEGSALNVATPVKFFATTKTSPWQVSEEMLSTKYTLSSKVATETKLPEASSLNFISGGTLKIGPTESNAIDGTLKEDETLAEGLTEMESNAQSTAKVENTTETVNLGQSTESGEENMLPTETAVEGSIPATTTGQKPSPEETSANGEDTSDETSSEGNLATETEAGQEVLENGSDEDEDVGSSANPESPSNFVVVHRTVFATLDNAWANAPIGSDYCATTYASHLPDGWFVANDTTDARIAIELYTFGTSQIVLQNITYSHQLTEVPGKASLLLDGSVQATADCPNRILIQRIEPADVEVAPFVEVPITNFVTFNGMAYAMADNVPVTAQMDGGCDQKFYRLPEGWSVAADNNDSQAVIISAKYPFKYICKVLDTGLGYDFSLGTDPQYNVCQVNAGVLVQVDSMELDATLVSLDSRYCGAIMISRNFSNELPTWNSGPVEPTNIFIANAEGFTYATLDNTPPDKKYYTGENTTCSDCCQNFAMALPDNWEVATSDMSGYYEASQKPWGTYCTGGLTHKKKPCKYQVTTSPGYAATRACDQRVLIRRTPVDCVSDWTEWSVCPMKCPGTQSRMRTNKSSDAMFGGKCEAKEERNCTEAQCQGNLEERGDLSGNGLTDEIDSAGYLAVPSAFMALCAGLALLFV